MSKSQRPLFSGNLFEPEIAFGRSVMSPHERPERKSEVVTWRFSLQNGVAAAAVASVLLALPTISGTSTIIPNRAAVRQSVPHGERLVAGPGKAALFEVVENNRIVNLKGTAVSVLRPVAVIKDARPRGISDFDPLDD